MKILAIAYRDWAIEIYKNILKKKKKLKFLRKKIYLLKRLKIIILI